MLTEPEPKQCCILGFESEKKACAYFTDGYNRNHDRGYEPSMSACINFIQFTPAIVSFDSIEDLARELFPNGPGHPMIISSISGHYLVAKLDAAIGKKHHEAGKTPALITRMTKKEYEARQKDKAA